jgi:hypothetical protein
LFFFGTQAIDCCGTNGGKFCAHCIGNRILGVERKEGDVFAEKDRKARAAHAVKGCPYTLKRLVACL